jgi:hypothetical protein
MLWWSLVACLGGDPGEVKPGPEEGPLRPLSDAPREAWLQQVWWQGAPGDVVEGVTTISGDTSAVVLGVALAGGGRQALVVRGPGEAEAMTHRVPDVSRAGVSDIAPDGHTRVEVERRGKTAVVKVTDTVAGGGQDLMRDVNALVLKHPSVTADGAAVFVGEEGALGGVWRLTLADGAAQQVVPGPHVATPTALRLADGREAVAFLEEPAGEAPRLVVAVRASAAPGDAAGLGEAWWPVVELGPTSARLEGCEAGPPLRLTREGDQLTLHGRSALAVDAVLGCGEGCVALAVRQPSGAPRLVAELRGAVWWLDPALGLASGVAWGVSPAVDALPVLRSCPPPLAEGAWASELRYVGGDRATIHGIEVAADRLLIHGTKGSKQPFIGTLTHADGEPRTQLSRAAVQTDTTTAVSTDGALEVKLEGGVLVGVRGLTGPVWTAPADVKPVGVAFAPDGSWLVVADQGARPGLWRVEPGAPARRLVDAARPSAPVVYSRDGAHEIAWVDQEGGAAVVVSARPMDAAARAAWALGAAGLVDVVQAWTSAQVRDGILHRCSGAEISLGLTVSELALRVGGASAALVAGSDRADGGVRLFGVGPGGGPRVVADIVPSTQPRGAVVWKERLGVGLPSDTVWLPEASGKALPDGGVCKGR